MITLIRPPTVSTPNAYSVPITPPLGVAYVAASLEAAGHRVDLIDAVGEAPLSRGPTCHPGLVYNGLSIDEIVARIEPSTDAVGISAMFSQEWPHTEQLVCAVRRRFPRVPIVLGGEHATAVWQHILETCPAVTLCVLGEGEETVTDLVDYFDGCKTLEEIPGVAFRRNGRLHHTPHRRRIRKLRQIPRPAWHLVPMETYLDAGFALGVDLGRSMPILATRGCPYQCTFCSNSTMWTNRYVMRDVTDVVDEIADYVEHYRARNIDFYDLTAIVKRAWILEFCRELERRELSITWQLPSGTRTEVLDAEVLRSMYRTGCRNVTYAPESGSERTLRRMKKRISLPRLVESVRAAKRTGLSLKCNIVIGLPGETRGDIWESLRFALRLARLGVDDVGLYLFSPYPGSELFSELREKGIIKKLDNDYFASLGCFMDFRRGSPYCEAVGPRELNLYRSTGMAVCYALSYATHPWRILRTIRNVLIDRSSNALEQRLYELKKRRLARRAGAVLESNDALVCREPPGGGSAVTPRRHELKTRRLARRAGVASDSTEAPVRRPPPAVCQPA